MTTPTPYNGWIDVDDIYEDEDDDGNPITVVTFRVCVYNNYTYVRTTLADAVNLYNDLSGCSMWDKVQ